MDWSNISSLYKALNIYFFAAKFYPNPALWTKQRGRETILFQECLLSPRPGARARALPALPRQPPPDLKCCKKSKQRFRRFANLQSAGKSKLLPLLRQLRSYRRSPEQWPQLPGLAPRVLWQHKHRPPGHRREQRRLRALGHPWRLVREDFWCPLQRILIENGLNLPLMCIWWHFHGVLKWYLFEICIVPRHKLYEGGCSLQQLQYHHAAVWDEGHCISFCRVMSQNGHQS